jgi:N-methylhydantoinase A/oxoprolinase/acetone carboxylase beta subunit
MSVATPHKTIRIGIDTGGTFTDFVRLDEHGMTVHKLRSVPEDPSTAIFDGIQHLTGGTEAAEITHGSTVATNAVLERKGASIALITTAGFEDVLVIGRQTRAELYNFMVARPRPLVEPGFTFGVHERLAADGSVLKPLDAAQLPKLIAALQARQVQSVAVCLLHSYANPLHEQALAQALRAAGFTVSASHEILPEYREYERWATTAVNAYVAPLMERYLTRLEQRLAASPDPARTPASAAAPLRIMQSNGGSISAARAKSEAVQTILSGPAAGVVGAQAVAAASGFTRIIAFDMGGTSTDVSLVDGRIGTTMESLVGDLPVRLPVLDIHTVGAGGGSIAWIDAGGSLRVGPRSAGANPGPACYGTGSYITVTDANLLLGRLDPAYFLGGRMSLDLQRTRSLARTLAKQLKLSERALAEGILRIANANMERAIRVVSVQRGFDARDFALLAFGGAGGLHACDLADSLGIATVLIPEHSGVLSALGMLLADVTKNYSASLLRLTASVTQAILHQFFEPMLSRARQDLRAEGFSPEDIHLEPAIDMRYKGQAYEIAVPFTPRFLDHFHAAHQKLYGYANAERATEIVQLRVRAIGRTTKPSLASSGESKVRTLPQPASIRPTVFGRRSLPTPVFHRDSLMPGMGGHGPAMVITGQSTNVISPAFAWKIDAAGTLVATRLSLKNGVPHAS